MIIYLPSLRWRVGIQLLCLSQAREDFSVPTVSKPKQVYNLGFFILKASSLYFL